MNRIPQPNSVVPPTPDPMDDRSVDQHGVKHRSSGRHGAAGVAPWYQRCWAGLASLRLTVGLLITSVFMIWVATLQQVEKDIWDVKKEHFPALTVYIPLYTFFPPAWLPEQRSYLQATRLPDLRQWRSAAEPSAPEAGDAIANAAKAAPAGPGTGAAETAETAGSLPIGLVLPSGFSLILAMIVNLAAAHSLRFRIQGQGAGLWWGSAITVAGIAVCTAVVIMGQSSGLQAQPPVPYSTMWNLILVLMILGSVGLAYASLRLDAHRGTERILGWSAAATMLGVPLLLWYSGGFIGDSGMRILWQIAQCSVASLVLLWGLQFLFKRKAGVVLLHGGLLLLLGNEIWVVLSHVEQRVSGREGDRISYAYDIRDVEMALIQRGGAEDRIITVPSGLLARYAAAPDQWQDLPGTELQFRVRSFYQNSSVAQSSPSNPANAGVGVMIQAFEAGRASGVSMDEINMASAYVQFRNTQEQDLGTYLVSQVSDFYTGPIFKTPNVIQNGADAYLATMWFKREYKPYDVQINDVQSKNYPGTTTPQWYATKFTITDRETGFAGDQIVWMNNPLRYRNETFYQSGYSLDPESGVETTTLQVVLNRGWMIPYLCCALVGIGLMAQFLPVMLAYLDKAQRPDAKFVGVDQGGRVAAGSTGAGARLDGRWSAPGVWIPTVAAVVLGLVFLGWGMPKRIKVDDLSLDRLAQIPLSYKGRIQPLDSLAQTMLRKSSGLEAARSSEETWFGKRKYPATRWLADLLFDPDAEINYQVFRVDNRQVLDAMKLPYRSGFRYSWDELETGLGVLTEMDSKARQKAKELRDNTDKSVLDLASNVAFARLVSNSLATRPEVAMNWNARLFDAASTQTTVNLPGVIPGQEAGAPWLAPNVARLRVELAALAAEIGSQRSEPLAVRMVQEAVADALLADPDFVQQVMSEGSAMREMGPAERKAFLLQRLATLTIPQLEATIRGSLQLEPEKYLSAVFSGMKSVVGGEELQPLQPAQVEALQAWEAIGQAYRQRDQAKLDQAVDRYTTALQVANADYQLAAGATEAVGIPWNKVRAEFLLNGWSPFYLSTVMYLFATLCAMFGMLALPVPVRRFTWTFLAIAFAIHTVGLVARIYISGRAPVTSIYSSALAISWGMVLSFLLIEWGTKKGVANFMGGLTGFLTLLVAYGLSLSDDTFAVLQAVLDTQFWLWTHVTIIALGYILTLVAGFWAIWMVVGSWSSRTQAAEMKRNADITYGLICAATLLSFVGTVLGGLWADDSWGRFWGWDPKENGAAMIVLWNAAILHARWAGLIRFQGLAAMAIFGNVVTAWSWFAVNELGVGLHSYGFTEGVVTYLTLFWLSQLACICLTLIPPANRGRLTAAAS